MKSFRTELSSAPASFRFGLTDSIVTIGSCFSDSIGKLLQEHKFKVAVNPLGTLYNPTAIHKALRYAITKDAPFPSTWIRHNGIISHLDFGASFSSVEQATAEALLDAALTTAHDALKSARFIIITYGTAWQYEHTASGQPVANCHRLPAAQFTKRLLTPDEIVESFTALRQAILKINPRTQFIVSLSPVRHLRDTMELNAVSKAVLRLAMHMITQAHPGVQYFPAFEIMMDDLRDYRFYKGDMLHPTDEAIGYIWEKFAEYYFDPHVRTLLSQWISVAAALQHQPFHPESAAHRKFLSETLARLQELKPFIPVDIEINQINEQLKSVTA